MCFLKTQKYIKKSYLEHFHPKKKFCERHFKYFGHDPKKNKNNEKEKIYKLRSKQERHKKDANKRRTKLMSNVDTFGFHEILKLCIFLRKSFSEWT